MNWTIITFGKYKGKTLPQVIFSDPDWFLGAVDKDAFKGKGTLETDAKELNYKVCGLTRIEYEDGKLLAFPTFLELV